MPNDLIPSVTCCWHSQRSLSHAQPSIIVIVRQPFFKSVKLPQFLAATKQLYEWFSLSITPLWLCSHHCIIMNVQELLPMTRVRSMQQVMVRGQRSRSQRSHRNLTVSGLPTDTWRNNNVMIMCSLRQKTSATSFGRNEYVIIVLCAHWIGLDCICLMTTHVLGDILAVLHK